MMRNLPLLLVAASFLASILFMRQAVPWFAHVVPWLGASVYDRGSFAALAASHLALVTGGIGIAALVGLGASIAVTRPWGHTFRPLVNTLAMIGQTFPPAAVLAVLVPSLGFGAWPTLVALALYGLLPITENALAGFASVPVAVREAAQGVGLSPAQIFWNVELPLAWPLILAGLRTAIVVGLGTATIGSTVGALTLGTPIIDGLVSNKPDFILQGAVPLALLAVLLELVFDRLDRAAATSSP